MVLTRTQIDSLLNEELFKEFLKCSNITDQLQSLTKSSDDFIKNTMSYIRSYWFRETITLCSQIASSILKEMLSIMPNI